MNLFSTPTEQSLRLYRGVRLGLAAFICLSVLLSATVACAERPCAYCSNDTSSAQGKEITYRGCLWHNAQRDVWVLVGLEERGGPVATNIAFDLVGDTSALAKYGDFAALSVRGIVLSSPPSEGQSGKLEVKHVEALTPVAELDNSLTDASHWIRKTDQTYGLSFAVPKEASFGYDNSLMPNDLEPKSVQILETSFPIYPESNYHDANLSIYVDMTASEKDTFSMGNSHPSHHRHQYPPTQSAPADKNFEWVNGIKYTQFVCEGYVRMDDCSVYTFQNNLSYRFDFWIMRGQPGMVEWGCLEPEIDEQQERSFLRLFFSHVSFFRPEVPAADGRHVTTQPPQIIRFEKTPLVRQNAFTLSLSLSWEARNADYVQLSYTCGPKAQLRTGQVYQASIEDPSFSRSCDEPGLPDVVANRPPQFSQKLTLYDQFQHEPVPLQITLTPFAHGVAFPQSSKSLSIDVPLP